jgi:hypothetical protein
MADHSFPCPHCGADTVGLKIVWPKVAPCPKCRRPVDRSAVAFATSCMALGTVVGWLVLGLPASGWFFYRLAELGLGMRLFLALVLPGLGAIVLGQVAFVFAYALSPFRPYGAVRPPRLESAPGPYEPPAQPPSAPAGHPVPLACPRCSADLRGAAIPLANRALFGGATHFSRVIGVHSQEADATVAGQCPECDHEWQRTEPFSWGFRSYPLIARLGTRGNSPSPRLEA